ncbi:MAG: allophanate hydrolase subunit 1 [Myxococcota bacterium]|nr:allophanate hydrolase subunit 1 [Myxococcota bacterium]
MQPFGDASLRVRLPEGANGRAVLEALRSLPGLIDAVVSERHAMVTFEPSAPPHGIEAAIERALARPGPTASGRIHTVAVEYRGDDLAEVARTCGMSTEEVVAAHADGDYVVAAIGFLPGFGYLRGLDARLAVPRRASPRPRVDPLSVAVAGPYTGIYPFASPGGWNLLGTAIDFAPFDVQNGAALSVGDRVRFTRTSRPRSAGR